MATVDLTLLDDSDNDDFVAAPKRYCNDNEMNDDDDHDSFKDPEYVHEDDEEEDDEGDEGNSARLANKDAGSAFAEGPTHLSKTKALAKTTESTRELNSAATPKYKKNPLVYRNHAETPPGDWTHAEVKALVAGVVKHDKGQWVVIKRDTEFATALGRRTTTAMASKYYQICKRQDPAVAQSLNNIAQLLRAQGNLDEAKPMHEEALAIRRNKLGSEHPDVAQSLNDIAQLLQDQGKLADAEPLIREAMGIYEKLYGKEHPDYALLLNNLAALLSDQIQVRSRRSRSLRRKKKSRSVVQVIRRMRSVNANDIPIPT